jgi:signal transduction histidine kinase
MGNGGALRITAEVTGANGTERVWFKFSDSGHGIDSANLKRVFEPFFTTKKDVGTGLGLCVVERIVADHDGELLVDSQTIGDTGTTFTVVLPGDSLQRARRMAMMGSTISEASIGKLRP